MKSKILSLIKAIAIIIAVFILGVIVNLIAKWSYTVYLLIAGIGGIVGVYYLYQEMQARKRYFIVCYSHSNKTQHGTGFVNFTTDGHFLNEKKTIKQISDLTYNATIIITNIIELSKEDYKAWIIDIDTKGGNNG